MRVKFRKLGVNQQLAVQQDWPALLPGLLRQGLDTADAVALAYNTAFLFHALQLTPAPKEPGELLDRLSIAQIARLCEAYEAAKESLEEITGIGGPKP